MFSTPALTLAPASPSTRAFGIRRGSVPYQLAIDGSNSAVAVAVTMDVPDGIPVCIPIKLLHQNLVCENLDVAVALDVAEDDVPFLYLAIFRHGIVHAHVAAGYSRP